MKSKINIQSFSIPVRDVMVAILLFLLLIKLPFISHHGFFTENLNEKLFVFIKITAAIAFILFFVKIFVNSPIVISIKVTDVLLAAYLIYVMLNYLFVARFKGVTIDLFELLFLAAFYLLARNFSKNILSVIIVFVIISAIVQSSYGLLQLYGVFDSKHGTFNITGSFFNPALLGGFLATIWPISLSVFLFAKKAINENLTKSSLLKNILKLSTQQIGYFVNVLYKYLFPAILFLVLLAIVSTHSRAAWLSTIATCGILLMVKYKIWQWFKTYLDSAAKKTGVIVLLATILAGGFTAMYYMKKDSASGRLIIWKSTIQMIKDKPLLGVGQGKFEANYLTYQASYLNQTKNEKEILIAGETNYCFNTILKKSAELGLLGFLFIVSILFALLYNVGRLAMDGEKRSGGLLLFSSQIAIIGLLVFSMFAYPEANLLIKIIFVSLVAIVVNNSKQKKIHLNLKTIALAKTNFNRGVVMAGLVISVFLGSFLHPYYIKFQEAKKGWTNAGKMHDIGASKNSLEAYEAVYETLKENGKYLLRYGKALSEASKQNKAIEVLHKASMFIQQTDLYITLGNNYKAKDLYQQSEKAYKTAGEMVPCMFYPRYLLAKLYVDTGQKGKAQKTALEVLSKKVKIQSTAIKEIKQEMKKIINTNK